MAGCGVADKNSRMPAFLRQPSDAPSQSDPEPDLKEVVRVNASSRPAQLLLPSLDRVVVPSIDLTPA
jgi:hypothetical protein